MSKSIKFKNDVYLDSSSIHYGYWIQQAEVSATITNGTGNIKILPFLSSDGKRLKICQSGATHLTQYSEGTETSIVFDMGIRPKHPGRSQCLFKDFSSNNALNIQSCLISYNTNGKITITCYHNSSGTNGRLWLIGDIVFDLD